MQPDFNRREFGVALAPQAPLEAGPTGRSTSPGRSRPGDPSTALPDSFAYISDTTQHYEHGTGVDNEDELEDIKEEQIRAQEKARQEEIERQKAYEEELKRRTEEEAARVKREEQDRRLRENAERRRLLREHLADIKKQRELDKIDADRKSRTATLEAEIQAVMDQEKQEHSQKEAQQRIAFQQVSLALS